MRIASRFKLAVFVSLLGLSGGVRPALGIEPDEYPGAVRRLMVWMVQTTDPTTFHPASPVSVMPFMVPEGQPLPEFHGLSATLGYSQYQPSADVRNTLSVLTQGLPVPAQFRSNKLTIAFGLSRRKTLGLHLIQYPAFQTTGGGLHYERLLLGWRPVFLSLRHTASRAAGSGWFDYTGIFSEAVVGLHWTGIDLFAGVGTRLARFRLEIAGDSASSNQWLYPWQRESWETHVGAEVFVAKKWALGGGIHFHPQGTGFGVRLIYKSRGTSTLMDPHIGRRRE